VFWAQNGFLGGFEGYGCCTSMPTHVWHYAQLAQRLWPQIDDRWESQWLDHELPGGLIPYRYIAPQFAMDGQNGVILGAYRYWTNTGNRTWLDRHWLQIAQAMEFERGETVEWVIEDKGLLVLKRRDTPPSALKKTESEG